MEEPFYPKSPSGPLPAYILKGPVVIRLYGQCQELNLDLKVTNPGLSVRLHYHFSGKRGLNSPKCLGRALSRPLASALKESYHREYIPVK